MDQRTEEIVCELQAQVFALRIAVRALALAHRDCDELLTCWRQSLEHAASNRALPAYARQSEHVAERCQAFVEDWTAELVELAMSGCRNVARAPLSK